MMISIDCFSQRGTGKAHNEDAVMLNGQVHQGSVRDHGQADTSEPCFFAIADGVSTSNRPRTASRRLLELLQARFGAAQETTSISVLLQEMQKEFVALGATSDFRGMATTLVGVRIVGSTVTVFNVGDSRAYLLINDVTGRHARLLSRDHSLLNDMIDDGEITQEQSIGAASFLRGLTSHFIADPEFDDFQVNVVSHQWLPGERLLLCSDGLCEVLSDAEIAALLAGSSDEDLLNAYKASRRAGGADDFSVIVLTPQ